MRPIISEKKAFANMCSLPKKKVFSSKSVLFQKCSLQLLFSSKKKVLFSHHWILKYIWTWFLGLFFWFFASEKLALENRLPHPIHLKRWIRRESELRLKKPSLMICCRLSSSLWYWEFGQLYFMQSTCNKTPWNKR